MPGADSPRRQWWILLGSCASLFLLMLDSTALTLALPQIQRDLGASAEELQWVINAYLLAMCVLVVTFSRLGDQFGRRTVFLAGNALFTVGAMVCAVAPSAAVLIAGRVLQGAGAAAMLGLSLAIVSNAFSDADRPRALGIWTSVSAVALAVGPLVGGILIDRLSWRAIFWMAVPIAVAGMAVTRWQAPNRRDPEAGRQLDPLGLLAITGGLGALVLALIQGRAWGWDSPLTLGMLVGGVALLAAVWPIEHRVRHPIIEFDLFRSRSYLGATVAAFAMVGAYWAVMYYQPQYLQNVLRYSPVEAGLLILPITAPMVFLSTVAGRAAVRFGVRPTMTLGMVLGTAGMLLLTRVDGGDDYWTTLFPAFLLFGIALALVYTPMSTAAMEALPRTKAGVAAGVLAMNRLLAGSLLLAVTGAVFTRTQTADAGSGPDTAFTDALSRSTWVLVAVMLLGTIGTWLLLKGTQTDATRDRAAADPAAPQDLHHFATRHHL